NRDAQLDCLLVEPLQQAPCTNKLGGHEHKAETDSQPPRAGEDKHCCPYYKKGETEDDLEKSLGLLHRPRPSRSLSSQIEIVVLHDPSTPFPAGKVVLVRA